MIFDGLSFNRTPLIIIKRIAIWEIDQPYILRGDVVAEIFWLQRLVSPASVTCLRLRLLDVESSSSHLT